MNAYLDDLQLSKIVFILVKFCSNKFFISADKGCLILVPRSDLFRPRDFYGFDRFEISHFLPFLAARMLVDGLNFSKLSPAKMGHFFSFLAFALSSLIEIHILSHEDMMNL